MRDLLEKIETGVLTEEQYGLLEDKDLILYYDGYCLTKLGWMLLLRDRAPSRDIMGVLDIKKPEYDELLSQLKEKSL